MAAIHSHSETLREQLKATAVEVLEIVPLSSRATLLTPEGLTDSHAMPVADFIAETMAIIRSATPKRPAITTPWSKKATRYSGNKAHRWAASCAWDTGTNYRSQQAG
jgi:short-subunit dehydrogenase involved in D-alanine esterification of teichoic acids